MNESIDCLLDANSIIKYYHDESGSDIIKYLFNESPSAQINILNLHIPEVVSVFHKLRLKNKIKSDDDRDKVIDTFLKDILDKRIIPYEYSDRHFGGMYYNFNLAYTIRPPIKRLTYFKFKGGYVKELKDIADTNDIAMLTIMQEITGIVGESYLFSSDGHVLEIARALRLFALNPEKMTLEDLPLSLDKRCLKRQKDIDLKVICKEWGTPNSLGTSGAINICDNGACINLKKKLETGKPVSLKISKQGRDGPSFEIKSEVVWSDGEKLGLKFQEPSRISTFDLY